MDFQHKTTLDWGSMGTFRIDECPKDEETKAVQELSMTTTSESWSHPTDPRTFLPFSPYMSGSPEHDLYQHG
uniref:Uncharacterized protein n=1 Tax=Timema poppense TaxID=170557 RepID=A0A7R9H904_TIMPO|nr:unnamed protein product [Timema poppensis]